MTDPNPAAPSQEEIRTIVQRRLVGLTVLLFIVFMLSLLLRNHTRPADRVPTVVIPLGQGSIASSELESSEGAVPVLDQADAPAQAGVNIQQAAPTVAEVAPAPIARERKDQVVSPADKPQAVTRKKMPERVAAAPAPKPSPAPVPPKSTVPPGWYVAVGAYKDPTAAGAIAQRVKLAGFSASLEQITVAGEKLNRVRAGPFQARGQAESARATLIVEGLTKSIVVSEAGK